MVTVAGFLNVERLLIVPEISIVISITYKLTGTDRQADRRTNKPRYWDAYASKNENYSVSRFLYKLPDFL